MNPRALLALTSTALLALTLSGCGGGDQVRKFKPSQLISFGDENSALAQESVAGSTISGLKYTVNELVIPYPGLPSSIPSTATVSTQFPPFPTDTEIGSPVVNAATNRIQRSFNMSVTYTPSGGAATTSTVPVGYEYFYNCGFVDSSLYTNRIWIQVLANTLGLGFNSACPSDARTGAKTYAAAGAKVVDVVAQIDAHLNEMNGSTMATVLAGQNDVVEQYDALYATATVPTEPAIQAATLLLADRARGLGQAVNRIADRDARVLLATLPDLGYSPKVNGDAAKQAVMTRLVRAFNDGLFSTGGVRINDGHYIGFVKWFEQSRNIASNPTAYGLFDGTTAVCNRSKLRSISTAAVEPPSGTSADLKYCNSHTLIAKARDQDPVPTAYNYLWALDTWVTPAGHASLANLAYQRYDNDTF